MVALYPESVAGRLSVPQENWISLYGGPSSQMSNDDSSSVASKDDCEKDKGTIQGKSAAELLDNMASGTGSIRERLQRTGLGALMSSAPKEDDTASISSKRKFVLHGNLILVTYRINLIIISKQMIFTCQWKLLFDILETAAPNSMLLWLLSISLRRVNRTRLLRCLKPQLKSFLLFQMPHFPF